MTDTLELLSPPAVENRQLFSNQPDLVEEYVKLETDSDILHGNRPPNLGITHEKPEHRLILMLKLEGMSNREAAQRSGYSEAWVSQVTRQPWFQRRLMDELRVAGRTDVAEFLKVQVEDSFLRIVQLRDSARSETVQAACAMDIINRVLGKPVQRTEVKMESTKKVEAVEDIRTAISELTERERVLEEKLSKYGN